MGSCIFGNNERNKLGLKDWTFVQLLFSNMLFYVQIILQEKWIKLGKSNSVKSHWTFASCVSYILILSILYIDHASFVDIYIHRNVHWMHRNHRIMIIDCPFASTIRVFTFFSSHASMLWSNIAVMFTKISMDHSMANVRSTVEAPLYCIYYIQFFSVFGNIFINISFELRQR